MSSAARRYATWIHRRRRSIVIASIAIAIVAGITAERLHVFADFSYLLPHSVRSVKDLRAIEARARAIGTVIVAVRADDAERRRSVAIRLRDEIARLPPRLVSSVKLDDREQREWAWQHRWLYADLDELRAARDALRLAANPLYISLDDPPLDKLRSPPNSETAELVSEREHLQIMVVSTGVPTGDVTTGRELLAAIDRMRDDLPPGVEVGYAGSVPVSVAEHEAILSSMVLATAVTVTLVIAALIWYFRSALAIGALSWALVVGVLATFAFTKLALGYLNLATAFLSSIVIGNGINVSILITARYLEELRAGRDGPAALAAALEHTFAGTLAAALTAAVAYASLMITVFRGFRHFGVIGGAGILLCWISAYTVLPAALAVARDFGLAAGAPAPLGGWLARLVPRRPVALAVATLAIVSGAGVVTARFLADQPFETNFSNLRSHGGAIEREHEWAHAIDRGFGKGLDAAFVIAVPRHEDVAPLERRLRATGLFDQLISIDDMLPRDQPEKLALLAEIRALVDDPQYRPPDDLRALGDADLPVAIAAPFIESDGSRGKLIVATAAPRFEVWDAHDAERFTAAVRGLELPSDIHFGGTMFVLADMMNAVYADGPRATAAALAGAILVVLIVLGFGRHAAVTIACGLSGTMLMLGAAVLLGVKINFLDFVALPITIGIGIEYAVNIATREREEGTGTAALATTGGAVAVCSYTTIVGYGSLLLSQNLGIRSFGLAAMIGEIACLAVAIMLAPALLALLRRLHEHQAL